jgi:serine phosphatase RsbU (regulator of sigma subunit)
MTLTRTLRRSGALVLAGTVLCALAASGVAGDALMPLGVVLLVFTVPVFAVSAIRHLMRGILWRVGSRLFVSYVLIGVVPILVLFCLLSVGVYFLAGQFAARRAESAFVKRQAGLLPLGQELLAPVAAASAPRRRALFEEAAGRHRELPGLLFAWIPDGQPPEGSGPIPTAALVEAALAGNPPCVLTRSGTTLLFGCASRTRSGVLLTFVPIGRELARSVEEETGIRTFPYVSRLREGRGPASGKGLTITSRKESAHIDLGATTDEGEPQAARDALETAAREKVAASMGLLEKPWLNWILPVDRPLVDWSTGKPLETERLVLRTRSSIALEFRTLFGRERFGRTRDLETGRIVLTLMSGLSAFALATYLAAALLAAFLVMRIARATRRLSLAFAEIEKGNFCARARLKGQDQLAELVSSFNRMASHLAASVSEKAEKEALDHELGVARDLQRRLLPPADFAFPGFEIAVDFRPATAIGGDFYDLSGTPGESLTVAVADVSGHGLPTGIVMASAKALLSALSRSGAEGPHLLTLLDAEITRTTDSRTFVTLAHLVFRLKERRVDFTNAGHLYPYRVTPDGGVAALANPARPLGIGLPAEFRTVPAPLAAGDLWVVLSDGIVEAVAAGRDEEFGFARLEAILSGCGGLGAATVRDRVLAEWRAFTGGDDPDDDRTLLVLRVLPTASA